LFVSGRRRHTRSKRDWSSDVCSSDLAATPALPVGVDPGDVAGIRITYTGTAIQRQASSAVTLDLALREAHRDTGADLSTETHTVDNVTTGSAAVADRDPAVDQATAGYT